MAPLSYFFPALVILRRGGEGRGGEGREGRIRAIAKMRERKEKRKGGKRI